MKKALFLLAATIVALSGCVASPTADEGTSGASRLESAHSGPAPKVLDNFCTASMALKGYC